MRKNKHTVILVIALLTMQTCNAAQLCCEKSKNYLKADPEMVRKWRDMKFGITLSWGPSSIVGTEMSWSRQGTRGRFKGTGTVPTDVYDNLYKSLYPAVRRRTMGKHYQGHRHKIHARHYETPRRILHVRQQDDKLHHHELTFQTRRYKRTLRCLPASRPQARLLLLSARLAAPRLPYRKSLKVH